MLNVTEDLVVSLVNSTPVDQPQQEQTDTSDCRLFVFIVYVVIFGTICMFGLAGNFLSLIVMMSERGSHVARFLLEVMAVTDNLFLATAGFAQIVQATLMYFDNWTHPILAYSAVIVWPLVQTTQMATVWMVVLVAFNRYVAICRPFQAPMLCTRKRVRIQIASILIFVTLYNIPRFFENELVYEVSSEGDNFTYLSYNATSLKNNQIYNILYENILYCLFVFLGPLVILIAMNSCLIKELAAVRRRLVSQNLPISGEEDENGLTMTMIVIILVFIICQTPAFFNQLLYIAIGSTQCVCGLPYYYYYQLSNVLVSTNSSANFVIYCVFRRQFRERLKRLCFHWCPKPRKTLSSIKRKYSSCNDDEVTNISLAQHDNVKNGYNTCHSGNEKACCLELAEVTKPLNPTRTTSA